ncbi:ABC transporter ATP-binding protein, partial [Streptomyces sp. NPDC056390]
LLRSLADEGRAVMLSSHLMSEMALIADHLVIIGRGRLLADTSLEDFTRQAGGGGVRVITSEATRLRTLLAAPDVTISSTSHEELVVTGREARDIGTIAASHGVPLYELTPQSVSLESAFMELTHDAVEYQSAPVDSTDSTANTDADRKAA